jgi:cyanate lyase
MPANDLTGKGLGGVCEFPDLKCESPVALTRKGSWPDGTPQNPTSYRFPEDVVTYGRAIFIEFRSVFVPETLTGIPQVLDSTSLTAGQQ